MKKLILLSILIFLMISSLVAVTITPVEGTVSTLDTNGENVSIKYSLNPDTATYDAFCIGFSTVPVSDFTEVTALADAEYSMNVPEGAFYGELGTTDSSAESGKIYIFWQIASSNSATINLTASVMEYISEEEDQQTTNYIDVTLETVKSGKSEENGNALSNLGYTEDATITTIGDEVLSYSMSNFTKGQCAGSQLIKVTTENITGKTAGEYNGYLTATIKAVG